MNTPPIQVAHCSTCGTTMTPKGECLACLMRVAFDWPREELASPIFGDYEIARREDGSLWELGRGAMGVTYRAEDKVLNRSVALKLIEAPHAAENGQSVRDRFLREARAAAAFRHPNVAGVFHFGASSEGDRCYYAMELVEGGTLEALVRRDGPLKVEAALEVAVQVTRALIAAAARGLVHRDLKPGNIMLTRSDDDAAASSKVEQASSLLRRRPRNLEGRATFAVKVIDFGLAKAIAESGSEKDLTQGGFVGTPAFASPEQFSGGPADARSDIYSLGVTLWYALTGEVPYEGKTIEEIRRGQSGLALPVDKLVARKIPKPVLQLLVRVLSLNPAQRPASARELMEAVELCRARLGFIRPNEWKAWPVHRKLIALAGLLAIGAVAFFAFRLSGHKQAAPILAPPKSIAVLPFQNLSDDKANAFFADAMQDQILTDLAKVADIKVISRTSVMQYKNVATRNLREIAQQLGVIHVLEGTVQRAPNRVRVTVQLIDARTDTHLWAEVYDRELADVFAIQSEIAQKIAEQLQVALSPRERAAIRAQLTNDLVAYDLYLRAQEINRTARVTGPQVMYERVKLLDQAVARDPVFVSALCSLARAHLRLYWFGYDPTPARVELAKKALDAAARVQPEAGDVHLARGLFYNWVNRDNASALAELALARRALPNDAYVLTCIGNIERQEGRWEEATRHLEQAAVLGPRDAGAQLHLVRNYLGLRRYADAARIVESISSWERNNFDLEQTRALIDVAARADLRRLESLTESEAARNAEADAFAEIRLRLALAQRDYRAAEQALSAYRAAEFTESRYVTPREWYDGLIASNLGDPQRARTSFLAAREWTAARAARRPDDAKALIVVAEIDARLGHKDEAIREGEQALALLPVAKDAVDGPTVLGRLAHVYAQVGEASRALDLLEQAARVANGPDYGSLKLNEEWDPLRKDPRFQKILASVAPKSGQ